MKKILLFFVAIFPLWAAAENSAAIPPVSTVIEAKAPEVKPEAPSPKIDIGQAKLNLLLQAWYLDDSTSTAAKNNFRARRAEVKLSGSLNPEARYFLMIDPAKSLKTGPIVSTNDNKVLQDLGLAYQLNDGWEIIAGQFKIPTLAEGLDSSGDLPLPERSLLARTFGDKRQLGVQTSYKEKIWKLTAMYSNGGASNTDAPTTAKDINVRADITPITGFSLGGWVGATAFSFGDNGKWGTNVRWKGEDEFARFELAHSDETAAGIKAKSDGYAAEVGYSVLAQLQPVFRFERFFPNSLSTDSAKAATLGLNYFLSKNNQKLQLAYLWTDHLKGANGSYVADMGIGTGRILVLCFQMAI